MTIGHSLETKQTRIFQSLVVACGVRKVWSKELKGLDKPSEQIRHLRQMLTDLGMSGRMSLEQAKAIKEKREFEQELSACPQLSPVHLFVSSSYV